MAKVQWGKVTPLFLLLHLLILNAGLLAYTIRRGRLFNYPGRMMGGVGSTGIS